MMTGANGRTGGPSARFGDELPVLGAALQLAGTVSPG
ncbi:MAG: hypothetical protein QOI21_263 [Actinomycetota bacterium]|jgi:hypothetical protein|nr:hypothetical protein [Actinomycetota bacterium]